MPPSFATYTDNPLWSDITPIPLDEGPGSGPALATIAYSTRYSVAMSYLRAVMVVSEYSERSLALTEDIISMNPAHYTVWLYRAKIVQETGRDIIDELTWLEGVSKRTLKNYQIW
jgi:protein farnesyltransferase/geranylgeranyltransferase type-1 subunit alpha